jgi:hypothetical protein
MLATSSYEKSPISTRTIGARNSSGIFLNTRIRRPRPRLRVDLGAVFDRHPTFSLAVVVEEKVVQDPGQPCFHVGSGIEPLMRAERASKCFLDQIVRVGGVLREMNSHPIEMIEVSHGLMSKTGLRGAHRFSLPGHGRILANPHASV